VLKEEDNFSIKIFEHIFSLSAQMTEGLSGIHTRWIGPKNQMPWAVSVMVPAGRTNGPSMALENISQATKLTGRQGPRKFCRAPGLDARYGNVEAPALAADLNITHGILRLAGRDQRHPYQQQAGVPLHADSSASIPISWSPYGYRTALFLFLISRLSTDAIKIIK
jgi:hypothetical protein